MTHITISSRGGGQSDGAIGSADGKPFAPASTRTAAGQNIDCLGAD